MGRNFRRGTGVGFAMVNGKSEKGRRGIKRRMKIGEHKKDEWGKRGQPRQREKRDWINRRKKKGKR